MIKKKKKKNRILITLCAMFLAVASVFAFIPFTRNDTKVVKADTVVTNYDFIGSNLFFPTFISYKSPLGYVGQVGPNFVGLQISFSVASSNVVTTSIQTTFIDNVDWVENGDIGAPNQPINIVKDGSFVYSALRCGGFIDTNNNLCDYLIDVFFMCNSIEFNSNIRKVSIGSYLDEQFNFGSYTWFKYYNYVKYIDINDNYLLFAVPISYDNINVDTYNNPAHFALSPRTYYLINDFTNNDFYNQGYQSGYTAGQSAGYDSGNSTGYNNGYNIGYNNGYTAGTEATNQYTFLNLISATIDAPIKYFQSLFNFELLGVNLQGFLTGLFTLCVIVTIIKVAL